jgi:hypothetical protein
VRNQKQRPCITPMSRMTVFEGDEGIVSSVDEVGEQDNRVATCHSRQDHIHRRSHCPSEKCCFVRFSIRLTQTRTTYIDQRAVNYLMTHRVRTTMLQKLATVPSTHIIIDKYVWMGR